jgi:hypothetical protein
MNTGRGIFGRTSPWKWMIGEENFGRASLWANLRSEKKERMFKARFGLRW